jgi:hypothetical protein
VSPDRALGALLAAGAAWLCLAAGAPGASAAQREGRETGPSILDAAPRGDLRSLVLLRFDCASALGRREVTLFGNGTVRLRDGPSGEEEMLLGELDPPALEGAVARLEAEDLSEARSEIHGVDGEWVERCVLELPLREGRKGPIHFQFSRYATLPLALSRVVAIAQELGEVAEGARGFGLPPGYVPRRGDILERSDGARFRVLQETADGKGVELQGMKLPLTLYLPAGELREVFVAVISRERPEP